MVFNQLLTSAAAQTNLCDYSDWLNILFHFTDLSASLFTACVQEKASSA